MKTWVYLTRRFRAGRHALHPGIVFIGDAKSLMKSLGAHLNSIGNMLDERGGIGSGFDSLRLVLASLVIVVHSVRVVLGREDAYGRLWLGSEIVVPMFFVLSGFLVTASAHHHSPRRFFATSLLGRGDYSYGIYLVGYPLQQLVWLSGLDRGLWWLNSLISLPLALIVASASWHLIEFSILRRRSYAGRRFVTASAEVQAVSGR